jgi:DNA polymerase-1
MPVGAVLGFCNMVNNLVLDAYIKGERPRLALIFDSKEGVSVRKTLYPQYKANRPPCPADLIPQFDLIKAAADAYGILKIEAPGHEADDVIATLANIAQKEGCKVNIYSADKDLMQLITKDGGITMVDPMKLTSISYDVVVQKWNVPPEKLGSVLALAGDSSGTFPDCLFPL